MSIYDWATRLRWGYDNPDLVHEGYYKWTVAFASTMKKLELL